MKKYWLSRISELITDQRSFASLLVSSLVSLAAGVGVGAVIPNLCTNEASIDRILILLCIVSVILFGLFLYVQRLVSISESKGSFNVTVWRDYPNKDGKGTAYDYCTAICNKARSSIVVVGPHFGTNLDTDTTSHTEYLEHGMSNAVDRHVETSDSVNIFDYTRIMQVDPDIFQNISSDGDLEANDIKDVGTRQHIHGLLNKNRQSETIKVEVYARTFIPSFPSILLVDDQFIFFSLPTYLSRKRQKKRVEVSNGAKVDEATTESRVDLNKKNVEDTEEIKLAYDFVLAIEDRTGEVVGEFKKAINQFTIEAKRINKIVGDVRSAAGVSND